jgi:hypothetical protein
MAALPFFAAVSRCRVAFLAIFLPAHDPAKWEPVRRKDHAL